MLHTIYKYPIVVDDIQTIEMPKGAQILSLQTQNGIPCIWTLIDAEEPEKEERTIRIFGTGRHITCPKTKLLKFIDTFQAAHGALIWHVFEEEPIQ